ncbi:hypothetical protein GCM10018772_17250 [Streptomyces fumanus]|uniref:Uncharacterized protein n=1 Tax=Streptomyces fumanus TaxID=67302 RepID=A0A919A918_9ACTN|nr:hypothetical protein GCM10018772_17250 [Streptomyces fumanus]
MFCGAHLRVRLGSTKRPTVIPAQKPEAPKAASDGLQPDQFNCVVTQAPMLVSNPA